MVVLPSPLIIVLKKAPPWPWLKSAMLGAPYFAFTSVRRLAV